MRRPPRARSSEATPEPAAASAVRLTMPSRREAVGPTVERVLRAARKGHLERERLHDLAVAVAEALSNAAVHGNHLSAEREVEVTVTLGPDGNSVTVEVADAGAGFEPAAAPDPTQPDRVLVPGGRGIFLMRRLADEVHYNAAGNTVRLVVRRGGRKDG